MTDVVISSISYLVVKYICVAVNRDDIV